MKQRTDVNYLLVALVMLALFSCTVGKKYARPSLELPQTFSGQSFSDTTSIADIEWKQFFGDTTLQRLIQQGLAYNHDLLFAIKQMEIAEKRLAQSKLLALPDLNLQVTGQYSRPSNNSLNGISIKSFLGKSHVENYQILASLSWEADVWGKIKSLKEATLARYLQTYEGVKAVQTQLVANIAQGFFNLLMLDKQQEIANRNLALSDSFLTATRLLKDAGIANALAVEQAESQRQSIALLVPQLEEAIAIQENALQLLTGQLPGPLFRQTRLENVDLPATLSAGLPAAMVSRRPDVRSNEMELVAANAEVGVAQANLYPALNITAGGGLESFKASNWFSLPNSLFGLAAGSIIQPVFQRKQLRTQVETAKLQREQAVIRFRQNVLQAITEVSNALISAEKLKSQELIARTQVDTLRQAITNSRLLFRSDMATYLEVITAQGNVLDAELNLAAIRRQELSTLVELYRSLGGGWK